MAKLNASKRAALPKKDFAVPSKAATPAGKKKSGSYPIPDASHARAALSDVSRFGSPAEKAAVRAKVAAKFPNIGKKGK